MDLFDKYMVSLAGEGRYGRYVDGAWEVVGSSKDDFLHSIRCNPSIPIWALPPITEHII